MKYKRMKLLGVAVGAAIGLGAASAGAVTVTGAGIYAADLVTFEGSVANNAPGPYNGHFTPGPVLLNIAGSATPIWAFCVDWNHLIGVGGGNQQPVNYTYTPGSVTTDSTATLSGGGLSLSQPISGEIQTLVDLGVAAAENTNTDPAALVSYQAAIWDVEYGLTQNPGDASISELAYIAADIKYAGAHPHAGYAAGLYDPSGALQGLAVAVVPEPSAWSLMLLGFGGLGVAVRSRRKVIAG